MSDLDDEAGNVLTRLSRPVFYGIFAGVCIVAAVILYFVFVFHPGPPPLDHGQVVAKDFTPAHVQYIPGVFVPGHESCTMIGKSESCSMTPTINIPPQFIPHNDEWRVRLTDGHRRSWRSVSHELYDQIEVGQDLDLRKD